MISLDRIQLFIEVASTGHFGAAAARVRLSQPAVSRQIRRLEEELGVELFDRSRRGATLTAAGARLLQEAPRLLDDADAMAHRLRREAAGVEGELRVGFVGPLIYSVVPTVIARLQRHRPGVHVRIDEMQVATQLDRLAAGRLDVGLMPIGAAPADLARVPLGEESIRVALPVGHARAAHEEVALADLASDDWILFHREFEPALHDFLLRLCADAGFAPRIRHRTNRAFNILGLVASGLGVAFAPRSVTDHVEVGGVVFRAFHPAAPPSEVGAVWSPASGNPVLRGFAALLSEA